MQITERRSTIRFACDGRCDNVGLVLVPQPKPHPSFHIDPTRYKVLFWSTAPVAHSGCRVQIFGHRVRQDGTAGQRTATRMWDLAASARADIPDWLRLVVEVDLYPRLPDWAAALWAANTSGLVELPV